MFPAHLKVVGLFAGSVLGLPGDLALTELATPASLGLLIPLIAGDMENSLHLAKRV